MAFWPSWDPTPLERAFKSAERNLERLINEGEILQERIFRAQELDVQRIVNETLSELFENEQKQRQVETQLQQFQAGAYFYSRRGPFSNMAGSRASAVVIEESSPLSEPQDASTPRPVRWDSAGNRPILGSSPPGPASRRGGRVGRVGHVGRGGRGAIGGIAGRRISRKPSPGPSPSPSSSPSPSPSSSPSPSPDPTSPDPANPDPSPSPSPAPVSDGGHIEEEKDNNDSPRGTRTARDDKAGKSAKDAKGAKGGKGGKGSRGTGGTGGRKGGKGGTGKKGGKEAPKKTRKRKREDSEEEDSSDDSSDESSDGSSNGGPPQSKQYWILGVVADSAVKFCKLNNGEGLAEDTGVETLKTLTRTDKLGAAADAFESVEWVVRRYIVRTARAPNTTADDFNEADAIEKSAVKILVDVLRKGRAGVRKTVHNSRFAFDWVRESNVKRAYVVDTDTKTLAIYGQEKVTRTQPGGRKWENIFHDACRDDGDRIPAFICRYDIENMEGLLKGDRLARHVGRSPPGGPPAALPQTCGQLADQPEPSSSGSDQDSDAGSEESSSKSEDTPSPPKRARTRRAGPTRQRQASSPPRRAPTRRAGTARQRQGLSNETRAEMWKVYAEEQRWRNENGLPVLTPPQESPPNVPAMTKGSKSALEERDFPSSSTKNSDVHDEEWVKYMQARHRHEQASSPSRAPTDRRSGTPGSRKRTLKQMSDEADEQEQGSKRKRISSEPPLKNPKIEEEDDNLVGPMLPPPRPRASSQPANDLDFSQAPLQGSDLFDSVFVNQGGDPVTGQIPAPVGQEEDDAENPTLHFRAPESDASDGSDGDMSGNEGGGQEQEESEEGMQEEKQDSQDSKKSSQEPKKESPDSKQDIKKFKKEESESDEVEESTIYDPGRRLRRLLSQHGVAYEDEETASFNEYGDWRGKPEAAYDETSFGEEGEGYTYLGSREYD